MKVIGFESRKGGQGTTSVAAVFATQCWQNAGSDAQVLLLTDSDGFAVCGTTEPPVGETHEVFPGFRVGHLIGGLDSRLVDTATVVVIDQPTRDIRCDARFLVTRACYLALKNAVMRDLRGVIGFVLIQEPDRVLTARDIEHALGLDCVATIPLDPAIARRNDAGLLCSSVKGADWNELARLVPATV